MNRYRSAAMNQNHHRLLIDNVRQDFLNGLELKRPNIISRRNHPTSAIIHHPLQNGIFNIETFTTDGPGSWTSDDAVVPIEVLSSNSFVVPDSTFPNSSAISLALEPTVVSQPVPPDLPLTYDSTCVSQAISTPIVSPIVSGGSLSSADYLSVTNSTPQPTFEVEISTGEIPGVDEAGLPLQILQDNDVYFTSIPAEEEFLHLDQSVLAQAPSSNQMRIETQADGSFVLFLDGGLSGDEPIELGTDTQIIQTDSYPVRPNVPFELPSQLDHGQTESFILVPIDDQGNTVLVPTSSVTKTRPLRKLSQGPTPVYLKEKVEEAGERPKPFRYDFPEVEEAEPYQEGIHMNMNLSSLVPQLIMEETVTASRTTVVVPGRKRQAPKLVQVEKESKIQKSVQMSKSDDDGVLETSSGTFKCKYCPREMRLRLGILNHINRIHKSRNGQELEDTVEEPLVPVVVPDDTVHPNGNTAGEQVEDVFAFRGENEVEVEPTFQLVVSASTMLKFDAEVPVSPSNVTEKDMDTEDVEEGPGVVSHGSDSNPPPSTLTHPDPEENDDDEISSQLKTKRKRVTLNGKTRQGSVESNLGNSEPPSPPPPRGRSSPRKYPPSVVQPIKAAAPPTPNTTTTVTVVRTMRTRSCARGGRCLRNSR